MAALRLRALGAFLARHQDAAGLSAGELGQRADLSGRQVRRVRAGADLSVSSLLALCDALALQLVVQQLVHPAVPLDQLVAVTEAASEPVQRALGKLTKTERRALRLLPEILARLTAEERRALLGF